MLYVSSAFSLNMLDGKEHNLKVVPLSDEEAYNLIQDKSFVSIIGHQDTAAIISTLLGKDVAYCRRNTSLTADDTMLVGQYIGPRLPEGTTTLPENARIEFYYVEIR